MSESIRGRMRALGFGVAMIAVVIAAMWPHAASAGQRKSAIFRGEVSGIGGAPLASARVDVAYTSGSGAITRSARTKEDGRWTIVTEAGETNYTVRVSAEGYSDSTLAAPSPSVDNPAAAPWYVVNVQLRAR